MKTGIRAALYLGAAACIWFAEDAVFSIQLRFDALQTAIVTIYFAALFAGAIWLAVRAYRRDPTFGNHPDFPVSRLIAMAPVIVVIVGSFAALPVLMLVLALGALGS